MDLEDRLASILSEIRKFCKANSDKLQITRYARYIKEGYDASGVPWKAFKQKKREILETYGDELGFSGFLDLGELLLTNRNAGRCRLS